MSPVQQKSLILYEKFGPLVLSDVPVPKPGKGHVLVKIHASALNPVDWKIQKYGFYVQEYPTVLGSDIAGEVVEVGEGVSHIALGDRVFFQGALGINDQSGFQQYAVAPVEFIAKIPPNLTYDQASTIPVGITAPYVGLYQTGENGLGFDVPTKPENRGKYDGTPIVIFGGSSAVGHFAIQLAKLSGFSPIITTASQKHEATLKALGATHVLDRNTPITESQLKTITSSPIKYVIDSISDAGTQRQGFDILAPGGKQVVTLNAEPAR
ncbi:hypothetical protein NMY22_g1429 [Coprinellus aureogranulatus]|nr:hypothetical protein NMY22_g1429 [Coprinellus aureogranulatus]